jgi:hypothetical protein
MSAVLLKGSVSPPYKATPWRNDLSGAPLRLGVSGNCAVDGPKRKDVARFLIDCDAPARAELARRERGKAGGAWEHAGAAAMRAVRSAAVADGGER